MSKDSMIRADATVSGRVQGVSFRYYTLRRAQMYGLAGWVKNLANGDVQAVLEGDKDSVEKMLEWLKDGPELANVDNLDYSFSEYTGKFSDFEIKF